MAISCQLFIFFVILSVSEESILLFIHPHQQNYEISPNSSNYISSNSALQVPSTKRGFRGVLHFLQFRNHHQAPTHPLTPS